MFGAGAEKVGACLGRRVTGPPVGATARCAAKRVVVGHRRASAGGHRHAAPEDDEA